MSIPVDPPTDLTFLWERVSEGKWLHLASLASLPPKYTRYPDHHMGNQLEKEPGLDLSFSSYSMTNCPKYQQLLKCLQNYSPYYMKNLNTKLSLEVTMSIHAISEGNLASGAFSLIFFLMWLSAEFSFPMVACGNIQCPTTKAAPKVCQELQTCYLASETNISPQWKSQLFSVELCTLLLQKESLN